MVLQVMNRMSAGQALFLRHLGVGEVLMASKVLLEGLEGEGEVRVLLVVIHQVIRVVMVATQQYKAQLKATVQVGVVARVGMLTLDPQMMEVVPNMAVVAVVAVVAIMLELEGMFPALAEALFLPQEEEGGQVETAFLDQPVEDGVDILSVEAAQGALMQTLVVLTVLAVTMVLAMVVEVLMVMLDVVEEMEALLEAEAEAEDETTAATVAEEKSASGQGD